MAPGRAKFRTGANQRSVALVSALVFHAAAPARAASLHLAVSPDAVAAALGLEGAPATAAYECPEYSPLRPGQKNIAEFRCLGGKCIAIAAYCDGIPSCPDGSDEASCGGPPAAKAQFDCLVGYRNWARVWSADKQRWCCAHEQRGCPTDASRERLCLAAFEDPKDWSAEERKYCCGTTGVGCAETSTRPEAAHRTEPELAPSDPYNCQRAATAEAPWPMGKRVWCCQNKHIGCGYATAPPRPAPPGGGLVHGGAHPDVRLPGGSSDFAPAFEEQAGGDGGATSPTSTTLTPTTSSTTATSTTPTTTSRTSTSTSTPTSTSTTRTTSTATSTWTTSSTATSTTATTSTSTVSSTTSTSSSTITRTTTVTSTSTRTTSTSTRTTTVTSTSTSTATSTTTSTFTRTTTATSTSTSTSTRTSTSTLTSTSTSSTSTKTSTRTSSSTTSSTTSSTWTTTSSTMTSTTTTTSTQTSTSSTTTTTTGAVDATMRCSEWGYAWEPLDMFGQPFRKAADVAECQRMCAETMFCAHFSFWEIAGDCHLQDKYAFRTPLPNFISGNASCDMALPASAFASKFTAGALSADGRAVRAPLAFALLSIVASAVAAAVLAGRRAAGRQRLRCVHHRIDGDDEGSEEFLLGI